MIRSRLAGLKHLVFAVLTLVLLLVLAEVGMRIYDSYTGQITRCKLYDQGLICRSWTVHHSLKPVEVKSAGSLFTSATHQLRTNSLGLRGGEITIPKPAGVYRIVCLGDDRTFAAGVPEEATFSAQLQSLLQNYTQQRVEVINAGIPDYCPLLSYLQVKHQLAALQADLFVLNLDMSDVADDYRYRRLTVISPEGAPEYCTHPRLLPSPDTGSSDDCDLLLLLQWGKRRATEFLADSMQETETPGIGMDTGRYAWLKEDAPDWSVYIQQTLQPIAHLKQLTRGMYADLMVATGPVPWQVSPTASSDGRLRQEIGVPTGTFNPSRRPFELIAGYCAEQYVDFCDASPAFRADQTPDTLYLNEHVEYSAAGHRIYTRELARRIVRNSAGIWRSPNSATPNRTETAQPWNAGGQPPTRSSMAVQPGRSADY